MKKLTILIVLITSSSFAFAQSVSVKDNAGDALIIFNEEGSVTDDGGSITLPDAGTVSSSTDKLYNQSGSLYWNGSALGTAGSAGGWTDDGAVVRLSIGTDKVGIGTTNPQAKLSVGADGDAYAVIYGETSANLGRAVWGEATNSGSVYNYGGFFKAAGSTGRAVFGHATYTDDDQNYGGYFLAAGNEGRGVYGEASKSGSVANYGGYFKAQGSAGYGIYSVASNNEIGSENYGGKFLAHGGYGKGISAEASGDHAIAVHGLATSTNQDFTTYGGYFWAYGNNSIGVLGHGVDSDFWADNASSQNYAGPSSIRWKKNIVEIDNPLDKLSKIRGVFFDWDVEHGGKYDVGCIAEEVGNVLPQIVVYEDNGIDAKGMDYSKLTPLLIEVAKTQQNLIESLIKRIEYLESN